MVASALNLHFKRNAVGDITAEGNTAGVPTPNESYVYDPLDRLQQVDDATGAPWQAYTYDKTGDRLSKTTAGQSPPDSYSYQSGTHRLLSISGYDVSNRAVDANGNTTAFQANGWTYGLGFNDANRLTMVQQNGSTIASYGINGLGERVLKTLQGGGGGLFAYDEAGKLLYSAPGPRRDYIWAGNTLVATIDGPQGTIDYVQTDQLGTPRAVTTTNGTLVWDWPYTQNPFGEAPASGNGYTLNLRFLGQYFDAETGLHYNYHRDYEPLTGRYIESDPIGLQGGPSTYAYVSNDPLNSYDVKGLVKWKGGYLFAGASVYLGGEIDTYNLTSNCSGGKSAIVTFVGVGTNFSISPVPIGVISGPIEFDDGDSTPNPQNFQGFYDRSGVDYTAGIGGGIGRVTAGSESTDFSFVPSPEFGISVGLGAVLGSSIVTSSSVFDCGCSSNGN